MVLVYLCPQEKAHQRKADIRDWNHPDYGALLKRRWRDCAAKCASLKHLPRGHRVAVYIKYPHFKRATEALLIEKGGRADRGRQSVSIFMGKSNWSALHESLGDEAKMKDLGGAIPLSLSTLKMHKRRHARSRMRKCSNEAGQINVSSRKVAKLLLPTAVEQPNGHVMNLDIRELERFGLLNAFYFDISNRDDKANFQLDNLYRKKRVLQVQNCVQSIASSIAPKVVMYKVVMFKVVMYEVVKYKVAMYKGVMYKVVKYKVAMYKVVSNKVVKCNVGKNKVVK